MKTSFNPALAVALMISGVAVAQTPDTRVITSQMLDQDAQLVTADKAQLRSDSDILDRDRKLDNWFNVSSEFSRVRQDQEKLDKDTAAFSRDRMDQQRAMDAIQNPEKNMK